MYDNKLFKLLIVYSVLCLPDFLCSDPDNLALLSSTLRTMQRAACDDEVVSLSCPRGTMISIQVAQYGKSAPDGVNCKEEATSTDVAVEAVGSQPCLWPNAMQYSLLQTVVEACQKKPQCKFSTRPESLIDPCPSARKFVEVAYKCRPYEFRSKTGCERESVQLSCNPGSRVAVLDANYGRTKYEAEQCPQPVGVLDESCLTPYAAETVRQRCHGKRRCEVIANTHTFGSPCRQESRTYLKIVYTCVPLGVLTDRYESPLESDEAHIPGWGATKQDDMELFDDTGGAGEHWSEPSVVPPAPAVFANPALKAPIGEATPPRPEDKNSIHNHNKSGNNGESKRNLFIYIGIGLALILIVVGAALGARCYYVRRTNQQSKSADIFTTDVPNVFSDGISDIDNDIDVSHISGTFYDPVHPDMILYRDATRGSLRAVRPMSTIYPCAGASMYGNVDYVATEPKRRDDAEKDVVVSPKSLSRYSNNQFYYG